ncbi:hypothetical protein MAR_026997 [Mya arenaria]|uniref:Uncharacterized protein n=1 Tax=Mya arenaria TaxID=6604 RepID=A0ABY7ES51_MYAAR|nr:hypothetical protein MAR_026997 [Mya arenaria]
MTKCPKHVLKVWTARMTSLQLMESQRSCLYQLMMPVRLQSTL